MGKALLAKKPQPKRIASDDCAVEVDGATYYPHQGEWVEVRPIMQVKDVRLNVRLQQMGVELEALKGEPDELLRKAQLNAEATEAMVGFVAPRLVRWNWTDMDGQPMAQPSAEALGELSPEEMRWLYLRVSGQETAAERKND